MNQIEQIWDILLSRDPALIQKVFEQLDKNEQAVIIDHLIKMSTEGGWHLEQKRSAEAAIEAINKFEQGKK